MMQIYVCFVFEVFIYFNYWFYEVNIELRKGFSIYMKNVDLLNAVKLLIGQEKVRKCF